jgi:hypothetical protein
MSFSMEHLEDRRPGTSAPRGTSSQRPLYQNRGADDVNWFPMVRAAFLAALTAFLVKLISLGFFANSLGISLEVQFWKGFIPHLSMQTPPADFARIVTSSTFVMAVVATVIFTAMVLRTKADKLVVWGWFMGVFVAFETLVLELLRHTLEPPVVDGSTVWRSAIPLTAGAAIAVVYSLITRERIEQPAAPRVTVATVSAAGDTRSVDARPAAFQGAAAVVSTPLDAGSPAGEPSAPSEPPLWTPPAPVEQPVPVGAGVGAAAPAPVPGDSATIGAALAAASVPNRIVDTRPASAQTPEVDPMDLPPARVSARPPSDVGPAPIVDTRPAAQRLPEADPAPAGHGPNDLSTRTPPASNK